MCLMALPGWPTSRGEGNLRGQVLQTPPARHLTRPDFGVVPGWQGRGARGGAQTIEAKAARVEPWRPHGCNQLLHAVCESQMLGLHNTSGSLLTYQLYRTGQVPGQHLYVSCLQVST